MLDVKKSLISLPSQETLKLLAPEQQARIIYDYLVICKEQALLEAMELLQELNNNLPLKEILSDKDNFQGITGTEPNGGQIEAGKYLYALDEENIFLDFTYDINNTLNIQSLASGVARYRCRLSVNEEISISTASPCNTISAEINTKLNEILNQECYEKIKNKTLQLENLKDKIDNLNKLLGINDSKKDTIIDTIECIPVSYTQLTLPTMLAQRRARG